MHTSPYSQSNFFRREATFRSHYFLSSSEVLNEPIEPCPLLVFRPSPELILLSRGLRVASCLCWWWCLMVYTRRGCGWCVKALLSSEVWCVCVTSHRTVAWRCLAREVLYCRSRVGGNGRESFGCAWKQTDLPVHWGSHMLSAREKLSHGHRMSRGGQFTRAEVFTFLRSLTPGQAVHIDCWWMWMIVYVILKLGGTSYDFIGKCGKGGLLWCHII